MGFVHGVVFHWNLFLQQKKLKIIIQKKWIEICEQQTVFKTAFEADRMSAGFAGGQRQACIPGVCGELPDCESCDLRSECCWYTVEGNLNLMHIEEKYSKIQ